MSDGGWRAEPGALAPRRVAHRAAAVGVLGAALAGCLVACLAAYAYYNDPWRPLGHALGPWVGLVCAVSARSRVLSSIARSVACLVSAVVTFYIALKVGHDIRWADEGSVMWVNWSEIQLWSAFAVVAGIALGILAASSTLPGWRGAFAAAALVGLLLGDAARRADSGGGWDAAVLVDVLLGLALFVSTTRRNRAPVRTALLGVLAVGVGLALISVPDAIQQLLVRSMSSTPGTSLGLRP